VHARAAQVEIAIAQARLFAGGHFVFDLEGRRLRIIEDVQPRGHHFDFTCSNFRIRLLAAQDASLDRDNEFRAQLFGFRMRLGVQLLIEDDLRDAGAVAEVNENQLAEVAAAMHPAHEDDVLIGVRGAECTAIVCAFQIPKRFEQFGFLFSNATASRAE